MLHNTLIEWKMCVSMLNLMLDIKIKLAMSLLFNSMSHVSRNPLQRNQFNWDNLEVTVICTLPIGFTSHLKPRGGTQTDFIWGCSARGPDPLLFQILNFGKSGPFHILKFGKSGPFHILNFKNMLL